MAKQPKCHFCGQPAPPICGTYASDENGKRICGDCRGQWIYKCISATETKLIWEQRFWIGLDGERHGGYPDPRIRKVQGKLF